MKRRIAFIVYWLLQLTWGGLLTWPGLLIAWLIPSAFKSIRRNGFSFIVRIGGNWGGLNLGAASFIGEGDDEWSEHARRHEFGHSLQNALFGPLQIFLVFIPSAVRYWWRRKHPDKVKTAYDDIWFEGTATKWGTEAIGWMEE